MFAAVSENISVGAFARDVAEGLMNGARKTLPSSWLYDEVGSKLFEVITLLPEYGLTRADAALLRSAAGEIIAMADEPRHIIELGSGTGTKTRYLLEAAAALRDVTYLPIDISGAALNACADALEKVEGVNVQPVEAAYLDGVERALLKRRVNERALVLFLGSTIGNFTTAEAAEFLGAVREKLAPGDCLLLGADLVKPREKLIRAYDDSLGVTAAFNLNLLERINRELGGEFVLRRFAHEARYEECHSRIEMHLRSRSSQRVWIGALDRAVIFEEGETIWTESSHKFRPREIAAIGEKAGWTTESQWIDAEWGFSETLFRA
ncbi:MAG: L-histidine N(alpha)-methyltransferase [Acidobacteriota bacterium]